MNHGWQDYEQDVNELAKLAERLEDRMRKAGESARLRQVERATFTLRNLAAEIQQEKVSQG